MALQIRISPSRQFSQPGFLESKLLLPSKPKLALVSLFNRRLTVATPSTMTDDERVAAGITKTLPRSLPQALEYLDEDEELVQELGKTFVTSYCHVKKVSLSMRCTNSRMS
jgi:hypothetical protein